MKFDKLNKLCVQNLLEIKMLNLNIYKEKNHVGDLT